MCGANQLIGDNCCCCCVFDMNTTAWRPRTHIHLCIDMCRPQSSVICKSVLSHEHSPHPRSLAHFQPHIRRSEEVQNAICTPTECGQGWRDEWLGELGVVVVTMALVVTVIHTACSPIFGRDRAMCRNSIDGSAWTVKVSGTNWERCKLVLYCTEKRTPKPQNLCAGK